MNIVLIVHVLMLLVGSTVFLHPYQESFRHEKMVANIWLQVSLEPHENPWKLNPIEMKVVQETSEPMQPCNDCRHNEIVYVWSW